MIGKAASPSIAVRMGHGHDKKDISSPQGWAEHAGKQRVI
jgi:hypothetical protein